MKRQKTDNKVALLNLHLWMNAKDIYRLIYNKLSTYDKIVVQYAHTMSRKKQFTVGFSNHCAQHNYLELYQWCFDRKLIRHHKVAHDYFALYAMLNQLHWPYKAPDKSVFHCAAQLATLYGNLNMLQWAFNEGYDDKSKKICAFAAGKGYLEILQWARANGCQWDSNAFRMAAMYGRLNTLQWAFDNGCPRFDLLCDVAIECNHVHVLEWALKHGFAWKNGCWATIAKKGNLDMLKCAYEHGHRWTEDITKYGHNHIVQWINSL